MPVSRRRVRARCLSPGEAAECPPPSREAYALGSADAPDDMRRHPPAQAPAEACSAFGPIARVVDGGAVDGAVDGLPLQPSLAAAVVEPLQLFYGAGKPYIRADQSDDPSAQSAVKAKMGRRQKTSMRPFQDNFKAFLSVES